MYQLIPLHSCDYPQKISISKRGDWERQTAEMKCDNEQTMKLE